MKNINTKKWNNAMAIYNGHRGPVTLTAILCHLGEELIAALTGKELGMAMNAANNAHHRGKAVASKEMAELAD